MPKLTIIIPCYNCEDTLKEAVDSCYLQGFTEDEFEIVLVNDASTDNTEKLINELASQHSNIRHFSHPKNLGGGATRNTSVQNSKSEIIFCLDSDDILPNNTLSRMLIFLEEKACDGVGIHHSIKFIGTDRNKVHHIDTFSKPGAQIQFDDLLQKNNELCSLYSTFMFTQKAFQVTGGYPTDHGFDTQGFAWRFLGNGLVAYTCPDTSYLHRIEFKKSYYLREAAAGRINYNWKKILSEFLYVFSPAVKEIIRDHNVYSDQNLFDLVREIADPLSYEYKNIIIPGVKKGEPLTESFVPRSPIKRFLHKIKRRLKKIDILWLPIINLYNLYDRIRLLSKEGPERKKYYDEIGEIKKRKKIVVDLAFGGIGDCLVFTTLPRLLKEKYDIDFYLSTQSLEKIRQKDTYKLCFELNPYFKGTSSDLPFFSPKSFQKEKTLYNFFTDKEGENVIERLERQFKVSDKGVPELYYKPKLLPEYKNTILIDKNYISGKKFNWKFASHIFDREAEKHTKKGDRVEYVEPGKQDLFTYVDMIYSSKYFICPSSGGASIAACFDKVFTCIWGYNALNSSSYNFRFKNSKGVYIWK
jgi:glycosyltransferase involved in cell wall biosynthesis